MLCHVIRKVIGMAVIHGRLANQSLELHDPMIEFLMKFIWWICYNIENKYISELTFTVDIVFLVFAACWFKSWFTDALVAANVVFALGVLATLVELWVRTFVNIWKLFDIITLEQFSLALHAKLSSRSKQILFPKFLRFSSWIINQFENSRSNICYGLFRVRACARA